MYDETKLSCIGSRIRSIRAEQELTQLELAIRIGVSQTHLSNIEHGRVQIRLKLLLRLANVLGRSLDDFLKPSSAPPVAASQGSYTIEEMRLMLQMLQTLKTTDS